MLNTWILRLAAAAFTAALGLPAGVSAAQSARLRPVETAAVVAGSYEIFELPTWPGFGWNVPTALNDRGEIVSNFCCTTAAPGSDSIAAMTALGHLFRLGLLPGFAATSVSNLNKSGLAVGTATGIAPSSSYFPQHTHAVAFTRAGIKDLGVLPGFTESEAAGVNDQGDAIGDSQSVTRPTTVTLFHAGKTIALGYGFGTAINNAGVAIGTGGDGQATLYSPRGSRSLGTLAPLHSIPSSSTGTAINDRGISVGYSSYAITVYPRFVQHAFVADTTGMHDLGVPAGDDFLGTIVAAYAINNLDEIVGYFLPGTSGTVISSPGPPTAFMSVGGRIRDLNSLLPSGSGWVLENAVSINDCGDIVGIGTHNGIGRAYRLARRQIDQPQLRWQWGCRR